MTCVRRASALCFVFLATALAQTPAELMDDPAVRAAFDAIQRNEASVIQQQIQVCEIPAPPFHEEMRGQDVKRRFEQLGLHDVRIDRVGNVIGVRPGKAAHPNLVFSAHLDTVFPEGTDVKVRVDGDILKAPGIGDDCRGLALMLGVIRALDEAHVETPGTITFVAGQNYTLVVAPAASGSTTLRTFLVTGCA